MQLNGYAYRDVTMSKDADGLLRGDDYSVYVPIEDGEFHLNFADGTKSVFSPLQFHFHAPSEHTVSGTQFDAEMHIVHTYKGTQGQLGAVIGIFFDQQYGGTQENPLLDQLWEEEGELDLGSFLS